MLNPFAEHAQFAVSGCPSALSQSPRKGLWLCGLPESLRRWVAGVGLVPRGEVGRIIAGARLSAGVVAQDLESALVVAEMLTTFVAPAGPKALYREKKTSRRRESLQNRSRPGPRELSGSHP